MNSCSKSGIHEHSPKSQIHIQIFHETAGWFSIDFPEQGEDGFHDVRCVRWYGEIVVPCRFCILLTCQLKNWLRVQGVAPKLYCFGHQSLLFSTKFQPQDCRSLLDATGPRCSSINPPRYASLSRTWDVDAASKELVSILIMLSGFPEAIGIPGLERFWHNSFFFFVLVSSSPLWSLSNLKFLEQQVLKWLIFNTRRRLLRSSHVKFPLVKMSASWCLMSM